MLKRVVYIILVVLILFDIGYSFLQFYHTPLDGDMAGGIVPANDVKQILDNPLGFPVLLHKQSYGNPNRFFSYWLFKEYFTKAPLFIQKFTDPISSVYLSCAIIKTLLQFFIIFLLSFIIVGKGSLFKIDFPICIAIIAPLFQINGYCRYMGIVDPSAAYTFSYTLPIALLLLYFLPIIYQMIHKVEFSLPLPLKILWIPLALVVSLSGPLNQGIVLIFTFLIFISHFKRKVSLSIPKNYWFFLIPINIFSLYSLYLGYYNSFNAYNPQPIKDAFLLIPTGIYYQFTQKLGYPVLLGVLCINALLIKYKLKSPSGDKILSMYKWIAWFSIIYIVLLPLGGYRQYRPNLLRYDTIIPISLSLFFLFTISTYYIMEGFNYPRKLYYLVFAVSILIIFKNADEPEFEKNDCEISALKKIAESKSDTIKLGSNCTVLSWETIGKPERSALNAELLKMWRITKVTKLYYNQ